MTPSPLPALLAALIVMTAGIATAQTTTATDPSLVYVRVTVTNSRGHYITALPKEAFKIFEDGKVQDTVYFSSKDVSISTGILVDARADTKDRIKTTAAAAFTRNAGPQDLVFLAEPGDIPLNDAVYQALNRVLQLRNRSRALILFTDRTNPGAHPFSKARELLRDQDVQFYAIAVTQPGETPGGNNWDILRDLAQSSGGNSFFPSSIASVENVYKGLASGLRNQYVIGYRPTNETKDGKWRKIKVTVEHRDANKKVQNFAIRAKPGYYAPTVAGSATAKD